MKTIRSPLDWLNATPQRRKRLLFLAGAEGVLALILLLTLPASGYLPGEAAVVACPLCFLLALPLHFLARPLPGFRPFSILLTAVGTAFCIACYNTETGLSPQPTELCLAFLLPSLCLFLFVFPSGAWCEKHPRTSAAIRILGAWLLLSNLIFTIVLWSREVTVFASSGCFATLIVLWDLLIRYLRRDTPEGPFALLSCAGFGVFLLVGILVLILLAAAGGDCDCDCGDGCCDDCDCGDGCDCSPGGSKKKK